MYLFEFREEDIKKLREGDFSSLELTEEQLLFEKTHFGENSELRISEELT
jgi:hypothetical protein